MFTSCILLCFYAVAGFAVSEQCFSTVCGATSLCLCRIELSTFIAQKASPYSLLRNVVTYCAVIKHVSKNYHITSFFDFQKHVNIKHTLKSCIEQNCCIELFID